MERMQSCRSIEELIAMRLAGWPIVELGIVAMRTPVTSEV
jgi:hypothetical protein